jgi:Bax protein
MVLLCRCTVVPLLELPLSPIVLRAAAWLKDFERAVLATLAAMAAILCLAAAVSAVFASPDRLSRAETVSGRSVAVSQIVPGALNQVQRTGSIGARFVDRFPAGWDRTMRPHERKSVFLHALLPLVLAENERIGALRRRLVAVLSAPSVNESDRAWLAALADKYGVKPDNRRELLRRVDTVLPSLALAQAAIESAWGTSRFAREGNALYGQWTTRRGGGLVPAGRNDDASHEVRAFADVARSVASYMHNLNTHRSYAKFRQRRARGRAERSWIPASVFAADLKAYSQRRHHYVRTLRRVISDNRLDRFDTVKLKPVV